jgi:hypothetical protein
MQKKSTLLPQNGTVMAFNNKKFYYHSIQKDTFNMSWSTPALSSNIEHTLATKSKNFLNPRFSKTLVLFESKVLKYRLKSNIIDH